MPLDVVQPYFTASTVSSGGVCSAGCAVQGQQLSVTPGVWGNAPTAYAYQWQDCTTRAGSSTGVQINASNGTGYVMTLPTTGSCVNAAGAGATSSTYTVGAGDVGKALAVRVTASNGGGSGSTTTSGSCATGLMSTAMPAQTQGQMSGPPASTYFDNGQPGCSPISAVVGSGQFGTGTAGEHFCTNAPVTCGFADIGNTGPAVGATLYAVPGTCTSPSGPGSGCANTGSGWSYSNGSIRLTSGATLQNVVYTGGLNVSGLTNVTIQGNKLVNPGESHYVVNISGGSTNITIQHNDMSGSDAATAGDGCDSAIFDPGGNDTSTNVTITNNNMWYCAATINDDFNGGWTIATNYIHDFAYSDPSKGNHFDGNQLEGNTGQANPNQNPLPFYNNTDIMDFYQTAPVILSTDGTSGTETNRQIVHNLLAGGSYSLYTGAGTTNSTFATNVFSSIYIGAHATGSTDLGGSFGPVTDYTSTGGNTWTGNIWDDNGASIG